MDSNSGNETATPIPLNTVRREMCLFVMNISRIPS